MSKPTCYEPRPGLKQATTDELDRIGRQARMRYIEQETTRLQDQRILLTKHRWTTEVGHRDCEFANRIAVLDAEYEELKETK